MKRGLGAFFCVFLSLGAEAAEVTLTSPPFTYVLDYGPQHINSPEYIQMIAEAPPTLLHLGKDVPFTHNWGPIQALGGENQAYGKMRPYAPEDYIRRLTPAEVRQRIADLTKLASDLHKVGVKWITPYICSMTIGGHAEKRTGFWEFYDHWDEYKEFGLGERPKNDPIKWMQLTPEGALHFFYKFDGPFYPPYEPNIRYAACHNNPDWRYWLEKVTENVARCGMDGVFVDNAGSLRCYCSFCKEKWRGWISKRYTEAERKDLFGTVEPPMSDGKEPSLLWAETRRFWNACIAEHLEAIRKAGERITGKPFIVFPNGGEQRPEDVMQAFPETDLIMFERSVAPTGTNPGMVTMPIVEGIGIKKYNDNIFENKFVQCLRRKVKPIMLTRPGWMLPKKTQMLLEMTPCSAALGCAETAAFGGGGGFLVRPSLDLMRVVKKYRDFIETHISLFDGLDSFAEVGVAVFPEQGYFGNKQHIGEVRKATQHLLDGHVFFDYVIEDQFSYETLKKFAAVVLSCVSHISDARVDALKKYVMEGGVALVIGPTAEFDEKGRKRQTPALDEMLDKSGSGENLPVKRCGAGATLYAEMIPAQGTRLVKWLKSAGKDLGVLEGMESPIMSKLRLNMFRKPGEARYVLHLLNYNVPLGVEAKPPEPVGPVNLALRLGEAKPDMHAICYDPEGEPSPLACKIEGGVCRIVVPEVRIYKIVEIK